VYGNALDAKAFNSVSTRPSLRVVPLAKSRRPARTSFAPANLPAFLYANEMKQRGWATSVQ
jgi:hypothetical protein